MTKPKKQKSKPMTEKQKKSVDEAARRLAEICIEELEREKSKKGKQPESLINNL